MQRLQDTVIHKGDDHSEQEDKIKGAIAAMFGEALGATVDGGRVAYGEGMVLATEVKVTYIGVGPVGAARHKVPYYSVRVYTYDDAAHDIARGYYPAGQIIRDIESDDGEGNPVCEVVLRVIHND